MKESDFRKLTIKELQQELEASLRELFNLRMQKATGQLTKPHLYTEAKKNVARIKTFLREKEILGAKDE